MIMNKPYRSCNRALRLMWVILVVVAVCSVGLSLHAADASARREPRVHDPSTIVKNAKEYWFFSTGVGVPSFKSTNLLDWTEGPRVFKQPPVWTTNMIQGNTGHFWAPDIIRISNKFHLYYSVSTFGKQTSAIGLATNPTLDPADPAYAWDDRGVVVRTDPSYDHNAIDPSLMLDKDGKLWMAYGSYWSGIKLVELDPQTGLRIATNAPTYPLAWNDSIEAAGLYRRRDSYYLFINWGTCCRGTNSTYNILVGRSATVTGPYVDREGKNLMKRGGTSFLKSTGKRIGPGHAAVLEEDGKQFLSFHYYNAEGGGRPRLEIVPLSWTSDGWPVAGTPMRD